MVVNGVPFEIYGRHPQKLNPDPGVVQLNECETGQYFLQNFQCTTMFISMFCKSCEPMLCEPEIVQKFCS